MGLDPAPSSLEPRPPNAGVEPDLLATPQAGPRAIRAGGLRVGSYVAGGVLGLVSAPLLLRHLGVAGFGRYATVVSLVALVAGVTEAGLGPVGVREYATLAARERERYMRDLLGLRLVLTAVGGVGATLFAALAGYGSELVLGTAVASLGLLIEVSYATYALALYARLEVGRQVAAELLKQVLSVALIVALVVLGASIVPFLAVSIPSGLVLLALTLRLVRGRAPVRPAFQPRAWGPILRDTIPVGAAVAVQALYFRCVIIVMSLVAPALETGYFATSYRIVEILLGIPVLLVSSTYPVLARAAHTDRQRLDYAVGRIFETALAGGGWLVLCTVVGAPLAISLIGGAEDEPATAVLRIQAATLLMAFLSAASGFTLLSMRRHREVLVANALALVVTLGLALALVGPHGAVGGAIATSVGEAVLALTLAVLLRRSGPRAAPSPGTVLRIGAAAAVGAGLALIPGLPTAVRLALAAVAYLVALAALGGVPWEIRDALAERLRTSS